MYGETLPLVQGAQLVIGHCFGALDQTTIDRKPLMQVDDPSFQKEKRLDMKNRQIFTGSTPVRSDELDNMRRMIKGELCNEATASQIEARYFREPDVSGDYLIKIKQALTRRPPVFQ